MLSTIKWDDRKSHGKIFQYESKKEKMNINDEQKSEDEDGDLSDTVSNKFEILNSGSKKDKDFVD